MRKRVRRRRRLDHFYLTLDGTMVSDMQHHITAWPRSLNEFGANLSEEFYNYRKVMSYEMTLMIFLYTIFLSLHKKF